MTAPTIEGHRQSAAAKGSSGSTHHAVRTIPAAEMARLKRATRRDLAYMKKHPVTNPWLDITTRANRVQDPVHWRLGPIQSRDHAGVTPLPRRTQDASAASCRGRDPRVDGGNMLDVTPTRRQS